MSPDLGEPVLKQHAISSPAVRRGLFSVDWHLVWQVALLTAVILAGYRLTLARLWAITNTYSGDANWGHAVFIPVVGLIYLYVNRERIRAAPQPVSATGFLVTAVALALFSYALWVRGGSPEMGQFLQVVSLVILLYGVVRTLAGPAVAKIAAVPIFYLLLANPWPDAIQDAASFPLQRLAAKGSVWTLQCFGMNAEGVGNEIHIFGPAGDPRVLNVAEACSGIRSLMTLLAAGAAVGFFTSRSPWRWLTLMLAAAPIAVGFNIIRIAGEGLLDHYVSRRLSEGFYHHCAGASIIIPEMVMMLVLAQFLDALILKPAYGPTGSGSRGHHSEPSSAAKLTKPRAGSPRGTRWLVCYTAVLAMVGVFAFLVNLSPGNLTAAYSKEPVPLKHSLTEIPDRLGAWQQVSLDQRLDPEMEAFLGATSYIMRDYVDVTRVSPEVLRAFEGKSAAERVAMTERLFDHDAQACIRLGVYYYTGKLERVEHVPENCYVGHGYAQLCSQFTNLAIGDKSLRVCLGEYQLPQAPFPPERRTVSYFFQVNARFEADHAAVRHILWNVFEPHSYFCKVELMTSHASAGSSQKLMASFLSELMPTLENTLPTVAVLAPRNSSGALPISAASPALPGVAQ